MKKITLLSVMIVLLLFGCQVDEKLDPQTQIPAELMARYNQELDGMDPDAKEALISLIVKEDINDPGGVNQADFEPGLVRALTPEEQEKANEMLAMEEEENRGCGYGRGVYYFRIKARQYNCGSVSSVCHLQQYNDSKYGLFYTRVYHWKNNQWRGPYHSGYAHNNGCPNNVKSWCLARSDRRYAVRIWHYNKYGQWQEATGPYWSYQSNSQNYKMAFSNPKSGSGWGGSLTYSYPL